MLLLHNIPRNIKRYVVWNKFVASLRYCKHISFNQSSFTCRKKILSEISGSHGDEYEVQSFLEYTAL
jgi:hypothetical protein